MKLEHIKTFSKFASPDGADLLEAARLGDSKGVVTLLGKGVDVNSKSDDGTTALHIASKEGNLNLVRILIAKGSNIDSRDVAQRTPLHWATSRGYTAVVGTLLNSGADVNCVDSGGNTPAHRAAHLRKSELLEVLAAVVPILLSEIAKNAHQSKKLELRATMKFLS